MKTGGNFPYLSRPDEMNMLLQVRELYYLTWKVHVRRVNDLEVQPEQQSSEPEATKESEGKKDVRIPAI